MITTGEHRHCFCTEDTGGRIVCCQCGQPLEELYDTPEAVLMWERMNHERDKGGDVGQRNSGHTQDN